MEQYNNISNTSYTIDWEVKAVPYIIEYKVAYPITEIDEILCQILRDFDGKVTKSELGVTLGFNVLECEETGKYLDQAEVEIYENYLKELFKYGLADEVENFINLTDGGILALNTGLKYLSSKASTQLFSNIGLSETQPSFAFTELGLRNELNISNNLKINQTDTTIAEALNRQVFNNNIYLGEITASEPLTVGASYKTIKVECRFSNDLGKPELQFYYNNILTAGLSDAINLPSNAHVKNRLIRRGLFESLNQNPNSKLTPSEIALYIELWDWKELVKDSRVDWSDQAIFEILSVKGDGGTWQDVSKHAPIEHIKTVLNTYEEKWDWTVLTERFDISFVSNYIKDFPWNFELISIKDPSLVYLLASDQECIEFGWDWDAISLTSSDENITKYAHLLPFNFHLLTEHRSHVLISGLLKDSQLLGKQWNWNYITDKFGLSFLIDNINKFDKYLKWETLLTRVFTNESYKQICLANKEFEQALRRQQNEQLKYYSIAEQKFFWDFESILFFEGLNLIRWEDSSFSKGFESNSNIKWDKQLFDTFKHHVKSEKGVDAMSKNLKDYKVIQSSNFGWNWDLLSGNGALINNLQFLTQFIHQLNWEMVIYSLKPNFLQDYLSEIHSLNLLSSNPFEQFWPVVTERVSEDFILSNFSIHPWDYKKVSDKSYGFLEALLIKYQPYSKPFNWIKLVRVLPAYVWEENIKLFNDNLNVGDDEKLPIWHILSEKTNLETILENPLLPWDWTFLTKLVIDILKINRLNDIRFVDKWDWKFISRTFTKAQVLEGLNYNETHWDWEYLLGNVFTLDDIDSNEDLKHKIITCINNTDTESRRKAWTKITLKYPIGLLYQRLEETQNNSSFHWDWDAISSNEHIPINQSGINKFLNNWNWSLLTTNPSITKLFDFDQWEDKEHYSRNVFRYLETYRSKWDWSILSRHKHLTKNTKFISKFRDEPWDWDFISEFGGLFRAKEESTLISSLSRYRQELNWAKYSLRNDVKLTESLISRFLDQEWDWESLSNNRQLKVSGDFLTKASGKPWSWQAISKRNDILINNQVIIDLKSKDWDWVTLSSRKDIDFTEEFITQLVDKEWDWLEISRNPSFTPTTSVLELVSNKGLDWDYLSKREDVVYDISLLKRFSQYLNWHAVTRHPSVSFSDQKTLKEFEGRWDWAYISKHIDSKITDEWLELFKDRIDWAQISQNNYLVFTDSLLNKFKNNLNWSFISGNPNIDFTKGLVENYEFLWDWHKLLHNPGAREKLGDYIQQNIDSKPTLRFLSRIDQQKSSWKGYIYHFAHIDNAVEIIKTRNIRSRNSAKQRSDAAGSVVHRRGDAHEFARFYFRPQTPTQFYNQFLGKDKNSTYTTRRPDIYGIWHDMQASYYDSAKNLGFPKCPIPIFFRFSLKEVLEKKLGTCYMSNGNMQTNRAKLGKFSEMVNLLNYDKLFMQFNPKDWQDYIHYSQQEFLIKEELNFEDLDSLEIICASEADKNLLIKLIEGSKIDYNIIKVDSGLNIFHHDNPRIDVYETEDAIIAKTSFEGEGIIKITSSDVLEPSKIIEGDILKVSDFEIVFKNHIKLKRMTSKVTFTFVDESNREWFIYKN
ncbi:DarT ssDNA thymidine ADP-ribosyltransferase family protein [Rufibacter soli]